MSKVGKIYPSILPYFDKRERRIKYKSRPILIIAEPIGIDTEYTVLPVSTISNQAFYTLYMIRNYYHAIFLIYLSVENRLSDHISRQQCIKAQLILNNVLGI